jgi:hypothetical protein
MESRRARQKHVPAAVVIHRFWQVGSILFHHIDGFTHAQIPDSDFLLCTTYEKSAPKSNTG